jgi:hypothetical protein
LLSTRRTLVILVTFTLAAHHNARNAIIAFRVEDLGFSVLDFGFAYLETAGGSKRSGLDRYVCYLLSRSRLPRLVAI